jgi:hypothetical protein
LFASVVWMACCVAGMGWGVLFQQMPNHAANIQNIMSKNKQTKTGNIVVTGAAKQPAKRVQYGHVLPDVVVPSAATLFGTVGIVNGIRVDVHPETKGVRLVPEFTRKTYSEKHGVTGAAFDRGYRSWLGSVTQRLSEVTGRMLHMDLIRVTRMTVGKSQAGGSIGYQFTKKLFGDATDSIDTSACNDAERANIVKIVEAARKRIVVIDLQAKGKGKVKQITDAKSLAAVTVAAASLDAKSEHNVLAATAPAPAAA